MNAFWKFFLFGIEEPRLTAIKHGLERALGRAKDLPGYGHRAPAPPPKKRRRRKAIVIDLKRAKA